MPNIFRTLGFSDTRCENLAYGDSDGEVGVVDIITCSKTPLSNKHSAIVSSVNYGYGSRVLTSGSFDQRGIDLFISS